MMNEVDQSEKPTRIDRRLLAGLSNTGSRTRVSFVVVLGVLSIGLIIFILASNREPSGPIRQMTAESPIVVVAIPALLGGGPPGVTSSGPLIGVGGASSGLGGSPSLVGAVGGAGSVNTGTSGLGGTPVPFRGRFLRSSGKT